MTHKIGLIHASPAAMPPLNRFFAEHAPELEITNLLDDGLLRLFSRGDSVTAERRLAEMLATVRDTYGAELAMLTCSAVARPLLNSLRARAGIPLLKIDEPMARRAVEMGSRIGVVVTFPPTEAMTRSLLLDAASEAKREIEILAEVVPDAYQALLTGDADQHDRLLLAAVQALAARGAQVITLAQVSMARVLERARAAVSVPVLTSLDTSLEAIRELLDCPHRAM